MIYSDILERISPKKGKLIRRNLIFGWSYFVKLKLFPTSFAPERTNVLLIHDDADDRIASIWFPYAKGTDIETERRMIIYSDVHGNGKHNIWTPAYPPGKMIDIVIEQVKEGSVYFFQVKINQQLIKRERNNVPRMKKGMRMYVSNSEHAPQLGYIYDLEYSAV